MHSGGRSRKDSNHNNLQNLRLFSYIWTKSKERLGIQYLSPREDGTHLDRNHIPFCDGFKVEVTQYLNFWDDSVTILDVSNINLYLYAPESVICDNMEYMAWVAA